MSMLPVDIVNQALDAIGWPTVIADLEEGTREAQVLLRAYGQCRRQLLRAANWNFARWEAPMLLLADRTGNTANVGTLVPGGWTYEYAYPDNCLKVRFIPWNNDDPATVIPADNIQLPDTPQTSGSGQEPWIGPYIRPAKFIEATDYNYPPSAGQITWEVQGVSPQGRTVILTSVRNARAIYTADMLYPSVWDALFRAALVAYIACEVAMPIWAKSNPKFGKEVRNDQAAIVRSKVTEARLVDGREGVPSADLTVDWMQIRNMGGPWNGAWNGNGGGGWDGPGSYGGGWDTLSVGGQVF